LAFQHHEARAGHPGGGFEVHQIRELAQVYVIPRIFDRERFAPATLFGVAGLALADGHIIRRQVRQGGEQRTEGFARRLLRVGLAGDDAFQALDLGHQGRCGRVILARLGLADLLGGFVAAALGFLQRRLGGAQGGVQFQQRRGLRRQAPRCPGAIVGGGVIADGFDVVHGAKGRARVKRPSIRRVAGGANPRCTDPGFEPTP
jgi:hypothetical protein